MGNEFDKSLFVMDESDMHTIIEILKRLGATNPDQKGFHLCVPISDSLYADAHITIRGA